MEINGVKIEVVPIIKILKFAAKEVISEYTENIKSVSKDNRFMIDAMINAPKGNKLDDLSLEWVTGAEGMLKLVEFAIHYHNKNIDNKKVEDILVELIDSSNQERLRGVVECIFGTDIVEDKKK